MDPEHGGWMFAGDGRAGEQRRRSLRSGMDKFCILSKKWILQKIKPKKQVIFQEILPA